MQCRNAASRHYNLYVVCQLLSIIQLFVTLRIGHNAIAIMCVNEYRLSGALSKNTDELWAQNNVNRESFRGGMGAISPPLHFEFFG